MRLPSPVYGALSLAVLVGLGASVYFGLMKGEPSVPVNPESVRPSDRAAPVAKEQNIEEEFRALKLSLGDAQLSLASADGKLKMRVWAESGDKEGSYYKISEGVMEFSKAEQESLIIKVSGADYRMEQGIAYVKGTLTGYVESNRQYFTAEELSWNPAKHQVTAKRVTFRSPHIEVMGEDMTVDLETGTVEFSGPVEAGI
jgi:hypothetical protein